MELNADQYRELSSALIDAFPESDYLKIMLKSRLGWSLARIVGNVGLDAQIYAVITYAQARDKIEALVAGATNDNPYNALLNKFASSYKQEMDSEFTPVDLKGQEYQHFEEVIRSSNRFFNPDDFLSWMGMVQRQVCRITVPFTSPQGQTKVGYGTGFLVGPQTVMTNYHVMEKVIKGQVEHDKVTLQFDYQILRGVPQEGTLIKLIKLAEDWKVDCSPYNPLEATTNMTDPIKLDELDYVLLKLERAIGKESVANSRLPDPVKPERGWIKLSDSAYSFPVKSGILIMQHPESDYLKLAMDTDAIIGLNQNRTRVAYNTNTLPGSSGSPCFNFDFAPVALHHGSLVQGLNKLNKGIPLDTIVKHLQATGKWSLLDN